MGVKLPLGRNPGKGAKVSLCCCNKSGKGVKTPVGLDICSVAFSTPACKAPITGRELRLLSSVASPKSGVVDAMMGAGNCMNRKIHLL